MPISFHSIGHSTRSIAEAVELLTAGNVGTEVDVRSVLRLRTNPQYNVDVLPEQLAPHGVGYEQLAKLGGLRDKSKPVDEHVNG